MKEKDDDYDDEYDYVMNQLGLDQSNQNNNEKDLIKENDINYINIINKIKKSLEEIKQLEKDNRKSTINNNNNLSLRQTRLENINIIIPNLDELIKLINSKDLNKDNDIDLKDLSNILKEIQILFYSNAEILNKINSICVLIMNILKDNEQIKIFLEIIIESLNYNDNNNKSNLLMLSLKILNDILKRHFNLIESIYDNIIPKILNILNLSKNNDSLTLIFCYKIITLFSKNNAFSDDLGNKGILVNIKDVLEQIKNNKDDKNNKNNIIDLNKKNDILDININININNNNINNENNLLEINTDIIDNNNNEIIEKDYNENNTNNNDIIRQIYILLKNLIEVNTNATNISNDLMEILLSEFLDDEYSKDQNIYIKIDFFESIIIKLPKSIENFVKYNGVKCILKWLKMNESNKKIILQLFNIINKILNYDKSYSQKFLELNFHEYIKEIMEKTGNNSKEIDFEGKSILFLIDYGKEKLENIEEYEFDNVNYKKIVTPKSEAINFLNSGKVVNIVNNLGEIKSKYLYFTEDLLKVIAKKLNTNLPPKQKYIIDTMHIKSVVKGHGTDVFQKSKRFYRSIPNANKCFSIIAFHPSEGTKSINVICKKENEVDKWVKYIKEILIYFQENQRITRNIIYNN